MAKEIKLVTGTPKELLGSKVVKIELGRPIELLGNAKTFTAKDSEMTITPYGVLAVSKKTGRSALIPYSNLGACIVEG
jgi:hypothetical protein